MKQHTELSPDVLKSRIRSGEIKFGGNRKLKIYGMLHCSSGKRMKQENRVFFKSEKEALENKYRPCGYCMKAKYKLWKNKE